VKDPLLRGPVKKGGNLPGVQMGQPDQYSEGPPVILGLRETRYPRVPLWVIFVRKTRIACANTYREKKR